jgi:hypothetical protein
MFNTESMGIGRSFANEGELGLSFILTQTAELLFNTG